MADEDEGKTPAKSPRGATAEELKGVSAVPTEGEEHGKGAGAHPKPAPGDEVDPGVG
jgi:hypothetical protein